jgi:hypothetical protein
VGTLKCYYIWIAPYVNVADWVDNSGFKSGETSSPHKYIRHVKMHECMIEWNSSGRKLTISDGIEI